MQRGGVSNSVTGICFLVSLALGCGCLLGLSKSDKIKILKPHFDLIIFQGMFLIIYAMYVVESSIPAAVGLIGGFAFFVASNGAIGRLTQAYLPKGGQAGKALARLQATRYIGLVMSSFLVTLLETTQDAAAALLYAT